MQDEIIGFMETSFEFLLTQIIKVLAYPFLPSQRIFWLYIFTSTLLALWVFYASTRSGPEQKRSIQSFINFLFPEKVWQTSSAWLDVRYFFFHQILRVVIYGIFLTAIMNLIFNIITSGQNLTDATSSGIDPQLSGIIVSAIYMIALISFIDFVAYGIHYFQHKIPFLWEFHKVHHSLEVMHPLSNYREHPIDNIVYAVGTGLAYGTFMGGAYLLFGYVPSMPQVLGVPLLMFAFNILGYNLRHSHVWLRWPGKLSMMFASPAHHHIHHSCHPEHIDKNFAFIFPFWDVLFSTYHLPETNEDVHFGISKNYVSEYTSCLGLYFIPFKKALALMRGKSVRSNDKAL